MMEKNTDSETNSQISTKETIGSFLRQKRESKDLSLRKISQETKIGVTILENIENDNLKELPNKTYVIGFVKSYAKVLGLKERECLEHLENTYDSFSPSQVTNILDETEEAQGQLNPLVLIGSVALFIVFIAIALVIFLSNGSQNENPQEVEEAKEEEIKTQVLSEETPLKKVETISVAPPPVEPQKVEPKKTVVTQPEAAPIKASEEKKTPETESDKKKKKIEFYSNHSPLFDYDTDMSQTNIDEYLPKGVRAAYQKDKQNIFVNAINDNTWLAYKADDEPVKHFILKKGKTLLIRGDVIRLVLGNINSTVIFYNNQPIKVESKTGVKSLIFPKDKTSAFLFPLFVFKKDGSIVTSDDYQSNPDN